MNEKIISTSEKVLSVKSGKEIKTPSYGERRTFEDSVEYITMPKYDRPGKPGSK